MVNLATLAISGLTELGLNAVESIVGDQPIKRYFFLAGETSPSNLGSTSPGGSFTPQVVIEEEHSDRLMITEHPVETGAAITDHAYKRPSSLTIRAAWATAQQFGAAFGLVPNIPDPGYLTNMYSSIREIQTQRSLVSIQTGKRLYSNMLLEDIEVTTDEKSEHVLMMRLGFREVILVSTVSTPGEVIVANPANPAGTAAVTPTGVTSANPNNGFNNTPAPATALNPAATTPTSVAVPGAVPPPAPAPAAAAPDMGSPAYWTTFWPDSGG